ncbi:hypothetical protein CCH79_00007855 [Gambusia affinis]|uniref:Glycosyltransferase 2-like domain-containing protein n=1 Tax=Gambusia affinis TaxID=33528 RepID=A0A315W2E2_GAMAF|nr:hypothetical protein CCH79_00007855 [Gambusia affinis]
MDSVLPPVQVTQPPRGEQQSQLLGGFDEKAYLAAKQLKPGDDPYREHAFNLQESDRLGSERAIRDTRHYRCASLTYDAELPSTSIIITFHNEARSTLLRTVKSVLMRSPPSLIQEIILIDDFSTDQNDDDGACCGGAGGLARSTFGGLSPRRGGRGRQWVDEPLDHQRASEVFSSGSESVSLLVNRWELAVRQAKKVAEHENRQECASAPVFAKPLALQQQKGLRRLLTGQRRVEFVYEKQHSEVNDAAERNSFVCAHAYVFLGTEFSPRMDALLVAWLCVLCLWVRVTDRGNKGRSEDCQLLSQIPKVRCLRNSRREGLIRSRVRGANTASATILTFLDSHCEVNADWLQPMIQRVKEVQNQIDSLLFFTRRMSSPSRCPHGVSYYSCFSG